MGKRGLHEEVMKESNDPSERAQQRKSLPSSVPSFRNNNTVRSVISSSQQWHKSNIIE